MIITAQTIVAAATPLAPGSIGVIRLSGDTACATAQQCFRCKNGGLLTQMSGYTAAYGSFYADGQLLDDGVALVFKAPHSYTGEEVVEISLHGGPVIMRQAIRALIGCGATQAVAGEFTKRAFLNGKLSLDSAEAVMDIIGAQSVSALQSANAVKNGAVFQRISEIKAQIVYCAAQLSAYIDFPEEGEQMMDEASFVQGLNSAAAQLQGLIAGYDGGAIIRNGVDCVIAGRPNVGKSTLMNVLSGASRSIVTPVAGTTRDVVRETVEIGGVVLRLSDTAGIHGGGDEVEKIGIDIAKQCLATAQLILLVFDSTQPINKAELELLEQCGDIPKILILNKSDGGTVTDWTTLSSYGKPIVISAKTGDGIERLKAAIVEKVGVSGIDQSGAVLANERQLGCVRAAAEAIAAAIADIKKEQTPDAVSVMLDEAVAALNELTGEAVSDTIINEVFAKFCVGK